MRLSTDDGRDEERAVATIGAAVQAGVTVFDTARAYGDNEHLVARALRACRAENSARIVTKGGMARTGGAWIPDGRAKAIQADCEASVAALGGLPVDLYLIHVPDPRTPWRTSLRALARLAESGSVRRVGVSNVNRAQLDEALGYAPVAAVEIALSPFDDRALRGGVVDRCVETGVTVIAHAPLGGPRRAGRLARDPLLAEIASRHDATPAEIALAWLLGVAPGLVAIPGARRPETAESAVRATAVELDDADRAKLDDAFRSATPVASPRRMVRREGAEVVLVMGIPGAGKTRVAEDYVGRGYARLNRDERQGSLRELAGALDESLGAGAERVVLDNTYLTRASRSHVVEIAGRHGARTRCVWLDTPLAQAQVNLVERLLERFGALPTPAELRAASRREPGLLAPASQMRALRELEPPEVDERFDAVERIEFSRAPSAEGTQPGVFVAAAALQRAGWERALGARARGAPHLVFDWLPGAEGGELAAATAALRAFVTGPVEAAICPHGAGPPTCWCRPPLPGLLLAFARRHRVAPEQSLLVGTSTTHRTLATTLGAAYITVSA
jgi:aryl-alcohol dehydrogenase-like predicted oxidoreductase